MKNIAGKKFGRLTVIRAVGRSADKQVLWECRCDCGTVRQVRGGHLRTGMTRSCGCLRVEMRVSANTKHGASAGGQTTVEYDIWSGMIQRCENPKVKSYKDYGARGIAVCERWRSDFANFLADMGPRPSPKHTIDRIKNELGYEPGNCHWATRIEQATNRRSVRMFTHGGETFSMKEWSRRVGIGYLTLWNRIERGWSFERAIGEPARLSPAASPGSS